MLQYVLTLPMLMSLSMTCKHPQIKVDNYTHHVFITSAVKNADRGCAKLKKCLKTLDIKYNGKYNYTCDNVKLD